MHNPELYVKLPPDLPGDSYQGICQAVSSLLELWGVPDVDPQLINRDVDPAGFAGNLTGE